MGHVAGRGDVVEGMGAREEKERSKKKGVWA